MSRTSTRCILKAQPITLVVASGPDLDRSAVKRAQSKSTELPAVTQSLLSHAGALIELIEKLRQPSRPP